jgi:hypothetical protein
MAIKNDDTLASATTRVEEQQEELRVDEIELAADEPVTVYGRMQP